MPAPVAQQIISATKKILGREGGDEGIYCVVVLNMNERYLKVMAHGLILSQIINVNILPESMKTGF